MFDWKKPTVEMLGRWQPWHDGHTELFRRALQKTGQVCILVRDVQGVDDNPFNFEIVKKNIEKQLEGFVRAELSGIVQRIQMTNGTMYLVLDKPSLCDFVHKEIRTFYKENINPDGGVNMYAVGDEFAFDFVPADAEAPVFTDEEESDIDIALNLEAESKRGK